MVIQTRIVPVVRSFELGSPKDTFFGDQEFFEVSKGELVERGEFFIRESEFAAAQPTATGVVTPPTTITPPTNGAGFIEPPIGGVGPGGAGEFAPPIGAAGTAIRQATKNPLGILLLLIGIGAIGYYLYKRYKK